MNFSSEPPQPYAETKFVGKFVKVLIADDHSFFRDGVINILGRNPAIRIVGAARDGLESVAMAIALQPEVILMDVQMPHMGGFAATREIQKTCPNTKVIIFSMFEDSTLIRQAIDCGARGYLLKDTDAEQLADAIISVDRGALFLGPGPAQSLATALTDANKSETVTNFFPDLSTREAEILLLLGRSLSNKEIADELDISLKTVRNHVSNILSKLGVATRQEAGRIARESQTTRH
jgi:DNA-binding NarL/FixJ family response regulator